MLLRRKKKAVRDDLTEAERHYGVGATLVPVLERHTHPPLDGIMPGPVVPIEDTFLAVDRKGNLICMVTVTPKGLWLGWDQCSVCFMPLTACKCHQGVTPGGGILHVYKLDGGVLPERAVRKHEPLPPSLALREPVVPIRRKKTPSETHVVVIRRRKKD